MQFFNFSSLQLRFSRAHKATTETSEGSDGSEKAGALIRCEFHAFRAFAAERRVKLSLSRAAHLP
jgi:hypothetical protein